MDGDIETCLDDSSDQCEEMNFDTVSRYYQILMQQAENAGESGEKINCDLQSDELLGNLPLRTSTKSRIRPNAVVAVLDHIVDHPSGPVGKCRVKSANR